MITYSSVALGCICGCECNATAAGLSYTRLALYSPARRERRRRTGYRAAHAQSGAEAGGGQARRKYDANNTHPRAASYVQWSAVQEVDLKYRKAI